MRNLVQLIIVLAGAAAIKLFYSAAGVEDLTWMIGPTTVLVEYVTGAGFAFESGAGYLSRDGSFLIAPVCAGINFFITAFLLLALYPLVRERLSLLKKRESEEPLRSSWFLIPVSLVTAYISTLAANAVRISIAYSIRNSSRGLDWATPEQIHRFEGIVIYFGFLLLLFFAAEKFYSRKTGSEKKPLFRGLMPLLPLAVYYGVAFLVPLLNGAANADGNFWRHSIYVLLLPIPPVLFLAIIRYVRPARLIKGRLRYHTNTQKPA